MSFNPLVREAAEAGAKAGEARMNETARQRYEAYAAQHSAGDGSSVQRAHLEQVVHTNMTNAGKVGRHELAAAKAAALELTEPALREWEAKFGSPMPQNVFKGVFADRPAPGKTDAEVEQLHKVLVEDFGAEEVAAAHADFQGMPKLQAVMVAMGTRQSGWTNRQLVVAHKELVASGRAAGSATRPWNKR
jgi:hypothetical protein